MKRFINASLLLFILVLPGASARAWEECGLPRSFPVAASGPNIQFFEDIEFQPGATTFPRLQSGVLSFGGHFATAFATERVPVQEVRSETYTVIVFVNGRPRRETREREVVVTVYVEQQVAREFYLPLVRGNWQAIDLCLFSWWNCFSLGRDGLVAGGGTTSGDDLKGTIVCLGVDGLPWGVYQLTSGTSEEGVDEGLPPSPE